MAAGGGPPTTTGSLRLGVFPAPATRRGIHRCSQCKGALVVHQPDSWHPGRLLGICKVCTSWCLMDLTTDGTKWLILPLPTGDDVRAAAEDPRECPPVA